jgi:hypothetical protein
MSEMRFCKDCKHYKEAAGGAAFGVVITVPDLCFAVVKYDLVSGARIPDSPKYMRKIGDCGEDGKLWEAKS